MTRNRIWYSQVFSCVAFVKGVALTLVRCNQTNEHQQAELLKRDSQGTGLFIGIPFSVIRLLFVI